jgi:hypothetical protein
MAPPWRRGAPTPPAEPSQRTARNAIIAGGLILLGLLVGTQFFSPRWTAPFEMERYVRAGARQGAALLEKDLRTSFPAGSDIGLLFTQLSRMGFSCGAVLDAGRGGDCRFRARREDNRVLTLVVVPRHDGVKLQSVAVSASMAP